MHVDIYIYILLYISLPSKLFQSLCRMYMQHVLIHHACQDGKAEASSSNAAEDVLVATIYHVLKIFNLQSLFGHWVEQENASNGAGASGSHVFCHYARHMSPLCTTWIAIWPEAWTTCSGPEFFGVCMCFLILSHALPPLGFDMQDAESPGNQLQTQHSFAYAIAERFADILNRPFGLD